jgi:hypothetical protein
MWCKRLNNRRTGKNGGSSVDPPHAKRADHFEPEAESVKLKAPQAELAKA